MVRKNQRSISRFQTCDKALELAVYTSNILANDKIFDTKFKSTIDRIGAEATMIYHNVRVANNIKVNDYQTDTDSVQRRLTLENEALNLCDDLITDIMISHKLFHLKASRVRFWTQLTIETQNLIKSWMKSEVERVKYNRS